MSRVISPDSLTSSECTIKHVYADLAAAAAAEACLLYGLCVCGCACVWFEMTVEIHEKHRLQSPRASAATPCDAVLSMGYKYTLLSSEGQQHRSTLIPHPLCFLQRYTVHMLCVCVCLDRCIKMNCTLKNAQRCLIHAFTTVHFSIRQSWSLTARVLLVSSPEGSSASFMLPRCKLAD